MNLRKYSIVLIAIATGFCALRAKAQAPGFVQQDVIKVSGVTTDAALYALGPAQRQTTKVFVDGLGRQVQAISEQASPTSQDIIQPVAWDNLGRQTTAYMPYSGSTGDVSGTYRSNALTAGQGQAAFYNQTTQYLIPVDTAARSQRVFENSPLQRMLDAGMSGGGFQPLGSGTQHYKKINYRPDSTTDGNIMLWYTNGTYSGTHYASKTLQVMDGIDEDGIEILTFTDKMGHLVLKRQKSGSINYDTYYIYNNAGMVSYVIPPLAVNNLAAHGDSLTSPAINPLLFKYVYNTHGQLVQRTIPGKAVMYIVYDPLNRPVLMRDSNMGVKNQWNYIKYDAKGRAISQGVYTDNNHLSLTSMQTYVSGVSYATWYESRSTTLTNGGYYTNAVFPTGTVSGTSITPLAYAYFDDYNITSTSATFTYVAQHDVSLPNEESPTTAMVKGMPTVVMKTTVGAGITSNTWLTMATFYDHDLHPIQVQSNNQLNYTNATTITDTKTIVTDFTGMPLYSKIKKARTSTDTVSVYTTITYDQVYRVTQISQKYNTGANNPVAAYTYNELGQLILKHLGYVSSTTWLQNVDYRYNIRGWLMSINNSKLTPDGGKTNNDSNDIFGMQLMYDLPDSALSGRQTLMYNGKPSGVKWMTRNFNNTRTQERSYLYTYDGFNRYTAEGYAERDSTNVGTSAYSINRGAFNEYISYDVGGNITKLSRYSTKPGGGQYQIDTLTYGYNTTNLNMLLSVTDGTDSVHTNHGFRNLTGSGTNYSYDANGNLTADAYKGISKITYDVLNRTDTVKISSSQYITYAYDANGNILRKKAYTSGSLQTTTDYVDGFVYVAITTGTPALSYFPMPEGRVIDSSAVFKQEFIITDPQGNARVAFRNVAGVAKVWQENSYYGTGLILPNSPVSTPTVPNKQLYNGGSEWQNNYSNLPDYYQADNRNYDAATGRFIGVDPLAEYADVFSGYQYAGNNPIIANDPSGARFGPPQYGAPGQNEFSELDAELNQEDEDWSNFYGVGWEGNFIYGGQDVTSQYVGAGSVLGYVVTVGTLQQTSNQVFVVDRQGNIQPYGTFTPASGETNDDVLFATDPGDGEVNVNNFLLVTNGILENIQSETVPATVQTNAGTTEKDYSVDYMKFQDNELAMRLFGFLANNTDVEWDYVQYGTNGNFISTTHYSNFTIGGQNFVINDLRNQNIEANLFYHDHPYVAKEWCFGPSGFYVEDAMIGGDKAAADQIIKLNIEKFGSSTTVFNIYDVHTQQIFNYNNYVIPSVTPVIPQIPIIF